jgi:NAD(P)-dependent dehydrogenase (short-subunit alcohol dehydrogenase family)
VADDVGDVLLESAPEMDVQYLQAPTDSEHGHIGPEGGGHQRQLVLVAPSVDAGGGRMGGRPVQSGVDVPAAHQDEGVEDGDHRFGAGIRPTGSLTRRQKQRTSTGRRHAVEVGHGKEGGRPLPRTPGGLLAVGREADERRRPCLHGLQYPTAPAGRGQTAGSVGAVADRLAGKVALITGAGSGIGRVAAELFAAEGAAVVVADVVADGARQTASAITAQGGRATAVTVDVADEEQVADMVGAAVSTFGGLHVLFNNAGIFPDDDGGVLDTPPSTWDRVMQVNLKGVWLGCRAAIPAMVDSGGGAIVNVASFVALMGAATAQVAYTASKGGVLAFTRELAVEYARSGVRANALCPGPIDTPLLAELLSDPVRRQRRLVHIPMGRLGRPEEIARAALFLASDESSFMTGSALVVDGGITAAYVTPE